MRELEEIAECLLDSDGTTRDITFTPLAAKGMRNFINSLRTVYRVIEASDADGLAVIYTGRQLHASQSR